MDTITYMEAFVDSVMTTTEDMIIYSQVTYTYEIKFTSDVKLKTKHFDRAEDEEE